MEWGGKRLPSKGTNESGKDEETPCRKLELLADTKNSVEEEAMEIRDYLDVL